MPALERPGTHRDVPFTVKLNTEPGRRMRWTMTTDSGLTETGVTTVGIEAAFKGGIDAAVAAIDVALDGKTRPGKGRKKSANDGNGAEYGAAIDVLREAFAEWTRESSDDNLARVQEAQLAADAQANIFYRSLGRSN